MSCQSGDPNPLLLCSRQMHLEMGLVAVSFSSVTHWSRPISLQDFLRLKPVATVVAVLNFYKTLLNSDEFRPVGRLLQTLTENRQIWAAHVELLQRSPAPPKGFNQ